MLLFKTANGEPLEPSTTPDASSKRSYPLLKNLKAFPLSKKDDLQQLIEQKILTALGLRPLGTGYGTASGQRIDTLAVDSDGALVIIEYKTSHNPAAIKQALSYLKWFTDRKSEFFEKLMIEKLGWEEYESIGLDWKNPRMIFIARAFSRCDIDAVDRVCARIELMRYCNYEGGIFTLEPANVQEVGTRKKKRPSGKYTLIDHVEKALPKTLEIFCGLQGRILALDKDITENPVKKLVGYRLSNNFAEIHFRENFLRIHLRPMNYDDPNGWMNSPPFESGITMNRYVRIKSVEESDYVFGLIEQSYRDVL